MDFCTCILCVSWSNGSVIISSNSMVAAREKQALPFRPYCKPGAEFLNPSFWSTVAAKCNKPGHPCDSPIVRFLNAWSTSFHNIIQSLSVQLLRFCYFYDSDRCGIAQVRGHHGGPLVDRDDAQLPARVHHLRYRRTAYGTRRAVITGTRGKSCTLVISIPCRIPKM